MDGNNDYNGVDNGFQAQSDLDPENSAHNGSTSGSFADSSCTDGNNTYAQSSGGYSQSGGTYSGGAFYQQSNPYSPPTNPVGGFPGQGFFGNGFPHSGGFSSILTKEFNKYSVLKELRTISLLVGAALLVFTAVPIAFSYLLSIFGLYRYYVNFIEFKYLVEMLLSVFSIFLPFYIVSLRMKRERIQLDLPLGAPISGKLTVFAVSSGLMFCLVGAYMTSLLQQLLEGMGFVLEGGTSDTPSSVSALLMCILKVAVLPALVEEFTMRGVVMQPLRRFGDKFAILMSSIVFSIMHGNMVQIPFSFIAGLVIGYFVIATGSMWTGILIHFFNNLFSVLVSYSFLSGSSVGNTFYNVSVSIIFVAGIASTILFFHSTDRRLLLKEQIYSGLSPLRKSEAFLFTLPMIAAIVILIIKTSEYVSYTGVH